MSQFDGFPPGTSDAVVRIATSVLVGATIMVVYVSVKTLALAHRVLYRSRRGGSRG